MKNVQRYMAVLGLAGGLLSVGVLVGYKHEAFSARLAAVGEWVEAGQRALNQHLNVVTTGGSGQQAYFHAPATQKPMPLVVSLHPWTGSYAQIDPLAEKVASMGWNYIHPDSRGRNNTPAACLSDLVISDIDEAIEYAKNNAAVDTNHVYVVGLSGGAYTSLGYYLKGRQKVNAVISWVPISDLESWYWQSLHRASGYAKDILACTGSSSDLDGAEARKRSPLHWAIEKAELPDLSLFAGLDDGYTGSVPISHSIHFFNKMAAHFGATGPDLVSPQQMASLLTRGTERSVDAARLEDRAVIYATGFANADLTIFDGGHEMLVDHTAKELLRRYQP